MKKVTTSADTSELSLTLYNGGFGAVKETRRVDLMGDEDELIFADVAQQIETDSLLTEGLNIIEFNYDFDLVDRGKLLNKYIDQEVYLKDRKSEKRKTCRLLSVDEGGRCVLEDLSTKEIYVDNQDELILPSLPTGLLVRPALIWKIVPTITDRINVSYLSQGFQWQANYVVELMAETLSLTGWAQIENQSGTTFERAKLKLIAGDVNRVSDDEVYGRENLRFASKMALGAPQAEEKSFFEYHLYTVLHPTTLKNNQVKQVCLLNATQVHYRKYFQIDQYTEKVAVIVALANRRINGLGMALPQGTVKMYQVDEADNSLEFIGEDKLEHTPIDEIIKLTVGNAFDITFEYEEMEHKKVNGFEYFIYWVTIKNHRTDKAEVHVVHDIVGNWEMVSSSYAYTKKSSHQIQFVLSLAADDELKLIFEYKTDIRKEIRIN